MNPLPTLRNRALNRFRPQVEGLEDRLCLTVASSPFSIAGTTLTINSTDASPVTVRYEGVSIDPHSHAQHGHIWAAVGGNTLDAPEIDKVIVNPGAGNEAVDFRLDTQLVTPLNLQLNLAAGNTSDLDFSDGIQSTSAFVKVVGAGNNTVTSRFGAIGDSTLTFNTFLGPGPNTFVSDLNGNLTGSAVSYLVEGGDGGNFIAVNAGTAAYAGWGKYRPKTSITVDEDSSLSIDLRGGAGNDTITTQFVGVLQGKYSRLITGYDNPGNTSKLSATDIILPGSDGGIYHGAIRGGAGNDTISQYLCNRAGEEDGGLESLVCWVDTETGHGSVNVSPGVAVYHNGADPGIQHF